MAQPFFHSFTWYDRESPTCDGDQSNPVCPMDLVGETLHVWVTYPDKKSKRKKSIGNKRKSRSRLKLWGIVVIDELKMSDDYTYSVTLKRVFRQEEKLIRIWVKNDPHDQSADARVFGFISTMSKQLSVLDEKLVKVAAKKVYDTIPVTWNALPGLSRDAE